MKRTRSREAAERCAGQPAHAGTYGSVLLPPAERLVGFGFRSWLTGYATGDIGCWEWAWCTYARELGPDTGRTALDDLARWVRAIRETTCRDIEVGPPGCAGFCQDECMAISMVAACQHNACPALKACAFALIESSAIAPVVASTETFAATLRAAGQVLSPAFVPAIAGADPAPLPPGSVVH